jgi:hypothetical protein
MTGANFLCPASASDIFACTKNLQSCQTFNKADD